MRINEMNSWFPPVQRPSNMAGTPEGAGTKPAGGDANAQVQAGGATEASRVERIARVREMVRSGQPVDLAKLADTLWKTGIFFDERV